MNVSLTPELEQLIEERVKSGLYNSASEVVREALRLLMERDQIRQAKLDQLRHEIQIGIDAADRGELVTLEEAMERLKRERGQTLDKKKGKKVENRKANGTRSSRS